MRELVANSLNDWGTALARKHEYAAAVLPFRYAAAEDPTLDPVMQNLGFSEFMSGNYAESEQALQKVVALHPDDLTSRAWLGMAQFENGEYSTSANTFQALGPALSSKPIVEATAAAAFARAGDRTRAAAALVGVDASASDPKVAARAALAAFDLGDLSRASELAQTALAQDPSSAEALRVAGDIDLENGQNAQAAQVFEQETRAASNQPEELAEAQALLAEVMIQEGRRTDATALRAEILRAHPDFVRRLQSRGELLLKNGDAHAAREQLGAALALAPEDAALQRELEAAVRESSKQVGAR
jgi:tetratricopeptide (TPR) repeat protein